MSENYLREERVLHPDVTDVVNNILQELINRLPGGDGYPSQRNQSVVIRLKKSHLSAANFNAMCDQIKKAGVAVSFNEDDQTITVRPIEN